MSELHDSLLARVAAALSAGPREIEVDWELNSIRVRAETPDGRSILGVVAEQSVSVIFYSVWPEQVPVGAEDAVRDYVIRANTFPSTCTLDYDSLRRVLSTRDGVCFARLDFLDQLPASAVFGLLWIAVTNVETAAEEHADAVAALYAGASAAEARALA